MDVRVSAGVQDIVVHWRYYLHGENAGRHHRTPRKAWAARKNANRDKFNKMSGIAVESYV